MVIAGMEKIICLSKELLSHKGEELADKLHNYIMQAGKYPSD